MYLTACGVPRPPEGADFVDLPLVMPLYVELAGETESTELFAQVQPWSEFWLRAVSLEVITADPDLWLAYGRYGQWFMNERVPSRILFDTASNRKHVSPQHRFGPGARMVLSANNAAATTAQFYFSFEGVERIFL